MRQAEAHLFTRRSTRAGISEGALRRLQHIAQLVHHSFGLSVVEVNLLRPTKVDSVVSVGAPARRYRRADTLCNIAARHDGLTVIPDTRVHEEARKLDATQGPGAIGFYVGYPIHSNSGAIIATLCVHDPEPQNPEDFDFSLLRDLGLLAEGELLAGGSKS